MKRITHVVGLAASLSACCAIAQNPVLAPTSSTTIDVNPASGMLAYASISIPAGVTVTFTGNHPVRVRVDGDVRVDGTLSVSAPWGFFINPWTPGMVLTGQGASGHAWSIGIGPPIVQQPASNGVHASLYGTAVPFDLRGGSPGGDMGLIGPYPCTSFGGAGGGTLVIEAGGRIEIGGTVTADGAGGSGFCGVDPGRGSGGSILLRGLGGCTVLPNGVVTAVPEGIIRLDAYDTAPDHRGSFRPTTQLRLPHLEETAAPTVGGTWQLRVIAPRGDVVFLAASFRPGQFATAYGTAGIDIPSAITFALVTMPSTGHDPIGTFQLQVPNVPSLAGLQLWVQGLDWFTSQPPRYTQTVQTVVR